MIQRINFIEKERIQITYGMILMAHGGAILVCLLLFLFALLSSSHTNRQIKLLNDDITKLKQQRESLMHQEEVIQGSQGFVEIHTLLKKEPSWFRLLNSLSSALPPNVWLSSFKSFDKEDSPSKKGILLNGLAKKPQSLAAFLTLLERIPYFEKVVLTSSKEDNGLFNFSVTCDISGATRR